MTAPGWYPDPSEPARKRYFDGIQWTDNYYYGSGFAPSSTPPVPVNRQEFAAGWYPDPTAQRYYPRRRYWDGKQWTNHYTEPELRGSGMRREDIIGICVAVAGLAVICGLGALVADDGEAGDSLTGLVLIVFFGLLLGVPACLVYMGNTRRKQRQSKRDRDIELAIHAENEHTAFMRGEDDRGTYGQYPPPPM